MAKMADCTISIDSDSIRTLGVYLNIYEL